MNKKTEDDATFKSILRCEIAYRKRTLNDSKTRPHLYKVNQLSSAELKVNLTLILTTESDVSSVTPSEMPTEAEMEKILLSETRIEMNEQSETSPEPEVTVNEPCIVVWDFEKS